MGEVVGIEDHLGVGEAHVDDRYASCFHIPMIILEWALDAMAFALLQNSEEAIGKSTHGQDQIS